MSSSPVSSRSPSCYSPPKTGKRSCNCSVRDIRHIQSSSSAFATSCPAIVVKRWFWDHAPIPDCPARNARYLFGDLCPLSTWQPAWIEEYCDLGGHRFALWCSADPAHIFLSEAGILSSASDESADLVSFP